MGNGEWGWGDIWGHTEQKTRSCSFSPFVYDVSTVSFVQWFFNRCSHQSPLSNSSFDQSCYKQMAADDSYLCHRVLCGGAEPVEGREGGGLVPAALSPAPPVRLVVLTVIKGGEEARRRSGWVGGASADEGEGEAAVAGVDPAGHDEFVRPLAEHDGFDRAERIVRAGRKLSVRVARVECDASDDHLAEA